MNIAIAENLTTIETIRALDADWCHPLPENVRSALVNNLINSAEELIDAKRQIEILKTSLRFAHYELEHANAHLGRVRAVLAKSGHGNKL